PLNSHHNFFVIHDGLDLGQWRKRMGAWTRPDARRELGLGPDDLGLLLVGTVCERKGQQDLARACALLDRRSSERLHCFIVGDRPSPYSRALAKLVQRLDPGLRARFHVLPETRDVALYYRAADLFVCTSRIESYPRVTLEAMAAGLPIVSTPVFGLSEQLVEGVNAVFYRPGDVKALSTALRTMVAEPKRRLAMAERSPQVFAGLKSFDQMAREYLELFQEAVESK
ncbi:MAG TPA: glycosyltransferase family 4 protein, partial [bacterium]|nr:glycosyltransferase family 4 protein [bacterium]